MRSEQSVRVLIIDDSRDAAYLLKILLTRLGHEVRVESSGAAGLETAKAFLPEVVLCDIGLPDGMDGYQVAKHLRADNLTRSALLVAVTGFAQDEDRQRATECGFDRYLTKPVSLETLSQLMSAVAAARPGSAAPQSI